MIKIDSETNKITLKGKGKDLIAEYISLTHHLRDNYSDLFAVIVDVMMEMEMKNNISKCKQQLNSMYGHFADATYADTDSIKIESEGETNGTN